MSTTMNDASAIVAEQQREREGITAANTNVIGADTNSLAEPTAECYVTQAERLINPLRTEADWQHRDRTEALLAEKVADVTVCGRLVQTSRWSPPCPATDYCRDHYPDSLPCEDATCPAVIAAWAREKEDV